MTDAIAAVEYDAAEEFSGRQTPMQRLQSNLHSYPWLSPLAVLVLTILLMGLLSDWKSMTVANISTVLQQTAVIGTLALGQTLIILTAGIDLSNGQIMVLASMVMAKMTFDQGVPSLLSLLIAIVVAGLAGLLNGILITKVKLPPFIVTLGTLGIFAGIKLLYATARSIQNTELSELHLWLGNVISVGEFRTIYGVIVMLALYAIFAYVLRYTAWGTHVYAVGDDPDASRLAGINTNRVIISVYVVASVVFGIAAWILIGRVQSAGVNAFPDANLDSITAVVVGGTSLFGGRGRIVGSLLGALIVAAVDNGLIVAGIGPQWRLMSIGALVIGAVSLDQWIRKARV